MKIIHTEASLGWGGQEIRILSEASGIEKMGHEIEIWASPNSNIIREATAMGLKIKPLPISEKRISNIFKIRSEIKKSAPDIINTHSSTDTWLVALANTTIRNSPPLIRTRHISAPVPKNFASRWLYTHATTHIVTTGNALKKQLVEENGFPASNITSIPTGIDIKRFYPGDRFEARKNFAVEEFNKIDGLSVDNAEGAFYLFVNIQAVEKDSMKFCLELLDKAGIATVPGVGFGSDGYFRFSYATDLETIKEGISRIATFVKNY